MANYKLRIRATDAGAFDVTVEDPEGEVQSERPGLSVAQFGNLVESSGKRILDYEYTAADGSTDPLPEELLAEIARRGKTRHPADADLRCPTCGDTQEVGGEPCPDCAAPWDPGGGASR